MSERKVLNKYYPPDFDPKKIPRLRVPKSRQYTVRIMTPYNMKCNTCGDYIAKAKKFNARKETVENESYLGLKIFRFYFKCPCCMAEITYKTDPKKCDYELEHGASRNFDAFRKAQEMAEQKAKEEEEEEKINVMKKLENLTKTSRREIENLEELEQIKEMNKAEVNHEEIIEKRNKDFTDMVEKIKKKQEEEDNEVLEEFKRYHQSSLKEEEEKPTIKQLILSESTKAPVKRNISSLFKVKCEPSSSDTKSKLSKLCDYTDSEDSS